MHQRREDFVCYGRRVVPINRINPGADDAGPSAFMTISATANIDPVFVASELADGDFTWTKPDGVSTFTGKAPAGANFDQTGGYFVACTDWSKVAWFYCTNDSVTQLNVSQATALVQLGCASNALTELDISANTALEVLSCQVNRLTALDVSLNTALVELHCESNSLTALDVSTNTALTYLRCNHNTLGTLDVSTNVLLEDLICNNAGLAALDLSTNTVLDNLYCLSNSLSTLDVSANTLMATLECQNNGMTEAGVDAILAALVANGVTNGTLYIGGTNAAPSNPDGWDDFDTLEGEPQTWGIGDIGPRPA